MLNIVKRAFRPINGGPSVMLWINRTLESLWLLAIILVPLAFLGRSYGEWSSIIGSFELAKITLLRTLAGLMASLWLIQLGLGSETRLWLLSFSKEVLFRPSAWFTGLRAWLGAQPSHWLILAVILYLGSTLLSTVLSASFSVSMWGDIPGQDSYSTYTVIAYLVVFSVIATHLRDRAQLWRLLGAVVATGVLVAGYGIFQHFGHDFLDLIEPHNTQRVSSTLGNATFAGAVLVMTIPVSLVLAVLSLREPLRAANFWWKLVPWVGVITVQLLGISYGLTRGPWIGTFVALVGLLGLITLFVGWRFLARAALALGPALVITVVILAIPWSAERENAEIKQTTDITAASQVADRLSMVGQQTLAGGLGGRFDVWKGSWRLMTDRPWFGFDTLSLSSLRPVIGYGPDFFRETYLLESPPNFRSLPSEPAHAHNQLIHQGVEQGFLGVFTLLGLFAALFLASGYQLVKGKWSLTTGHKLVLAVLLATLAGRFLEQMLGVGRVSDLTLSWVLLGTFAALPVVMREPSTSESAGSSSRQSLQLRRTGPRSKDPGGLDKWSILLRFGVAVLVVGIGLLTWTKSINYFRAGIIADQGAEHFREGRLQMALLSLDRAIDLAPDVSTYYGDRASAYLACQQIDQKQLDGGISNDAEDRSYDFCQPEKQHERNQQWVKERPFNFRSWLALADSSLYLGLLKKDDGLIDEATLLYQRVSDMTPNSWTLWNRLAEVYIQVGDHGSALPWLERSLEVTGDTTLSFDTFVVQARAYHGLGQLQETIDSIDQAIRLHPLIAEPYFIRGTALYGLNRFAQALEDLDQAVQLDPQHGLAYNTRGLTHARMGRLDLAIGDFNQTVRIIPEFAAAYNNRGFAYRDLGNIDLALKNLDQAIELDPGFTMAYFNRALAYTLLGEDSKAQQDSKRAVDLGIDPGSLQAALAEVKNRKSPD